MTTKELHNKAMRLAQDAICFDRRGLKKDAMNANQKAYGYEKQAAMTLLNEKDKEPIRSILFKSAGWLAIDCGDIEGSKEMAKHGLDGRPPEDIRIELESILMAAKESNA